MNLRNLRAAYGYLPSASSLRIPQFAFRPSQAVPPVYALDSIVKGDWLVNDDAIGGTNHRHPRWRSTPPAIARWPGMTTGTGTRTRSRSGSILRAIASAGISGWTTTATCGGTATRQPGLARDGNCLIVWEDRRHANSDVLAQRYVGGIPVDTNFQVNDPNTQDQRGAEVTFLPDGRSVVAWEDWRRNNGAIYAQVLAPDAKPIGDNFWVNFTGTWQAYGASIGSDRQGDFALAWEDAREGWDVWCQRYDSAGETLGTNFRVNNVTNLTYNLPTPSLAMFPDGGFVVVWSDFREDSLHANVYAQLYDVAGETLGTNFRVNDSLPGIDHYSAWVTNDQQGNWLVCWTDTRNGRQDVYAQAYDTAGRRTGANFKVNDDPSGATSHSSPSVAWSPRDEYWLTWVDAREGPTAVYAQRLAADRTPIGPNFRVNDDSFSTHQRVPTVVANSAGSILTIWEDERNGNTDVYCQFSDSLGNPVGANQKVNDDNVGADHFYSTAAMDETGNSITAWTDGRNSYNIYAQAFGPTGNRTGSNFRVNDVVSACWSPAAAKDSAGNSVIVFSDLRSGPFRIYGQRYDAQNQPVWPVRRNLVGPIFRSATLRADGRNTRRWR